MKARLPRYILMLNSTLMLLYGIGLLFDTGLITDNLETYSSIRFEALGVENPALSDYIIRMIMLLGLFNLLLGLVGVIVIYLSFTRRHIWILILIFITNILGYLGPVIFDVTTGVITSIEVIEMISFAAAMIAFLLIVPEFYRTKRPVG